MAMETITTSYKLNMQTIVTNRRRRIGAIICKLNNDDKVPGKEISDATKNQWRYRVMQPP